LAESERRQLTEPVAKPSRVSMRRPVRPMAEYVAFATFAARFVPPGKAKPIPEGKHWKL